MAKATKPVKKSSKKSVPAKKVTPKPAKKIEKEEEDDMDEIEPNFWDDEFDENEFNEEDDF